MTDGSGEVEANGLAFTSVAAKRVAVDLNTTQIIKPRPRRVDAATGNFQTRQEGAKKSHAGAHCEPGR